MSNEPSKDFWDERYRSGETPWDYGGPQPEFIRFLREQPKPLRILIPGCGSGHDLRAALQSGHDAIGLDLSNEAVKKAQTLLGADAGRVSQADFFRIALEAETFDVVYERTFLCAIPIEMRKPYAQRVVELLKPGGLLLGYFIYGQEPDPPPYPLSKYEDKDLLLPLFEPIESKPSEAPLSFFKEMEMWQIWKKRWL